MVLQRDKPLKVRGIGPVGKTVEVFWSGKKYSARVGKDQRWNISVPIGRASQVGRTLEAICESQSIKVKDVLVGDVWFLSGQSNMELGLSQTEGGLAETKKANNSNIRLFLMSKASSPIPLDETSSVWQKCGQTALSQGGWGGFSAVGYWFGKSLVEELNVPIGLILGAFGGSKIHPFIHPEELKGNDEMAGFSREIAEADQSWNEIRSRARADSPEAIIQLHPFSGFTEYNNLKPATAWNALVSPLANFPVRGVLWYQGESDVGNEKSYLPKWKALVRGFRRTFGDKSLPVFTAQIAPWTYGPNDSLLDFWEMQKKCGAEKNCGLVATVDVGDLIDIHPLNKKPVGERFAKLALAKVYGKKVAFSGPTIRSARLGVHTAVLRFDTYLGKGLGLISGLEATGFEFVDANGAAEPARAVIKGEEIHLHCPNIAKAKYIRFAWRVGYPINLTDKGGIPALPFQI